MRIEIDQFVTRCRVPPARRSIADLADRVARERFAAELSQRLGPSLGNAGVVRIRRLPVRLRMNAGRVNEEALTQSWLAAFTRELFSALAYPSGAGPMGILRYDSTAAFHAAFLRDFVQGDAAAWQYREFRGFLDLAPSQAILYFLRENAAGIVPTLAALDELQALDAVIARLDDLAVEQLFIAIARNMSSESAEPGAAALVRIARLAESRPAPFPFGSRCQALCLFVRAQKAGIVLTPRAVFHCLAALAILVRQPGLLSSPRSASAGDVLRRVRDELQHRADGSLAAQLADCLAALQPLVPGAATPETRRIRSVSSECAAVFLLAPLVERLEFLQAARASRYLSGGLALAVLDSFDPEVASLDPAVQLFAGFTGEPDMNGMRRFFAATPGCSALLDSLAARLLAEFAARIAGFRQSPRPAIVRQFIRQPGVIHLEENRIVVELTPSPFHVALHISGLDQPIEPVGWLGNRRLEFRLEGL